jgi:tRNA threonylcarbamoyladenosine biosynthesis protein TsaE
MPALPMHEPILESRDFIWPDEAACADYAAAIARKIVARPELGDAYVELRGPLGAGKTTFARHLLRALGVEGRIKSPTYALVEGYELPALAVSHFDFYRFADAREWADAGLRDLFAARGLKLAEWPENAGAELPSPDLRVMLEPIDSAAAGARAVRVEALSPLGEELIR